MLFTATRLLPVTTAASKLASRSPTRHSSVRTMAASTNVPFTLYTQGTPNGHKASIVLEEVGAEYKTVEIRFSENEQKSDWFLKINPNGRIPALVDHTLDDQSVFESGAIMLHVAEKYSESGLLPKDPKQKAEVISWLMFQMGGVGPMQGQANHFIRYAPVKIGYGMKRYNEETKRLYSVLENTLSDGREWLVGSQFTLADAAQFPWVASASWAGVDIKAFPKLQAWTKRCWSRPAVKKGCQVPSAESMAVKLMDNDDEVAKNLEVAQKTMKEAGADEAVDGQNAAFNKK